MVLCWGRPLLHVFVQVLCPQSVPHVSLIVEPVFDPRPILTGLVVDKMTLLHVFVQVLWLPLVSPPCKSHCGACVRSQADPYGICGGQNDTGTCFCPGTLIAPSQYHPTRALYSFIRHQWYIIVAIASAFEWRQYIGPALCCINVNFVWQKKFLTYRTDWNL
jgi:hypothetical protein